ncbi:hypothetical protein ACEPAI_1747 [Sanghuangporus weigelae]
MASQSDLKTWTTTLQHNRLSNYVDVCSCTILIYDYLLTFNAERTLIWPSSWSTTKTLFLLTRYAPFIDITIILWQLLKPHMSPKDCDFVYKSTGWLLLTGILIAEIILMLRTWAVYEQRRAIAIGLVIWTILTWVPNMVSLGIFLDSLRYGPLPITVPGSGCHVVSGSPIVFVSWALLMIFEAAILILMIIKSVKNYRNHRNSFVFKAVFRDGSIFYLYLFVLSMANVIVILTSSADLINLLSVIERVIHSVLTARIILNLRKLGTRRQLGLSTFSFGVGPGAEMEFAHNAISSTEMSESTAADNQTVV